MLRFPTPVAMPAQENRASSAILASRATAFQPLETSQTQKPKKNIDATGLIVCPGFIDAHSHSDTYLLLEPTAASKVYQGITTEICGNCGASAAPLLGDYKMPADWLDKTYSKDWESVADYHHYMARNFAFIRRGVPNVVD